MILLMPMLLVFMIVYMAAVNNTSFKQSAIDLTVTALIISAVAVFSALVMLAFIYALGLLPG